MKSNGYLEYSRGVRSTIKERWAYEKDTKGTIRQEAWVEQMAG